MHDGRIMPVRSTAVILLLLAVGAAVAIYAAWERGQETTPIHPGPATGPSSLEARSAIRIGLVPERDVFAMRRSYQGLLKYLEQRLGHPVRVATLNSYEAVLADFREMQIEGAFLGSLVALLAMDRDDAQVLVKPEQFDGCSTYRGVIFVREDSPAQSVDDVRGRSIAMLKATYAGSLFPISEMAKRGMLQGAPEGRIVWMGTHDEVIATVMSGRAEVGAVKDLRLAAFEKANPDKRVRRLATSKPVPNNALVLRKDVAERWGKQIAEALLNMDSDPAGREALAAIGAKRFVACQPEEYEPIYEIAESLGAAWEQVGVGQARPSRPGNKASQ